MSDNVVAMTALICVTMVTIVAIFAILAYLKEKATLKFKNDFKEKNSEIAIDVDNEKNSKKQ